MTIWYSLKGYLQELCIPIYRLHAQTNFYNSEDEPKTIKKNYQRSWIVIKQKVKSQKLSVKQKMIDFWCLRPLSAIF